MLNCIAIRKETKDKTQQRAPLTPTHVRELVRKHKITVIVEPWEQRIFKDREYQKAGATLSSDLWDANVIFGVKEIAPEYLYDNKAHCFFTHTIKGQSYNMGMLQHILHRRITLMDYELVHDREGKRLIFFSDFAGYAGMIDSLWAMGQRLNSEGIRNPFSSIKYATKYESLASAEEAFQEVGEKIWKSGLPGSIVPFICGFTGYGRVATAAQKMFDLLPTVEIEPENLRAFYLAGRFSNRVLYKVNFRKPDMFHHKRANKKFDPVEFQTYPERFTNRFEQFVPMLSMIVNGVYWEPRFPKLVTKKYMKALYKKETHPRLRVIGDITCDIDGSIELTVKETNATNPVYVYEPVSSVVRDGVEGRGPVILAVDKLPTELPREASEHFGSALLPFVPALARKNYQRELNTLTLPAPFQSAVIAHQGKLAPRYAYLKKYLLGRSL